MYTCASHLTENYVIAIDKGLKGNFVIKLFISFFKFKKQNKVTEQDIYTAANSSETTSLPEHVALFVTLSHPGMHTKRSLVHTFTPSSPTLLNTAAGFASSTVDRDRHLSPREFSAETTFALS